MTAAVSERETVTLPIVPADVFPPRDLSGVPLADPTSAVSVWIGLERCELQRSETSHRPQPGLVTVAELLDQFDAEPLPSMGRARRIALAVLVGLFFALVVAIVLLASGLGVPDRPAGPRPEPALTVPVPVLPADGYGLPLVDPFGGAR